MNCRADCGVGVGVDVSCGTGRGATVVVAMGFWLGIKAVDVMLTSVPGCDGMQAASNVDMQKNNENIFFIRLFS